MHKDTLTELSASLGAKRISARELAEYYLERIERFDPALNAFVTVTSEQALKEADAADRRIAAGTATPLTGIPLAHKDIFCTAGVKTSCSSRMLDNFISPYDATVVARLKDAGAVLLGKTNMDEFAMGSSNETSYYGPVRNPWDHERVPGGSSGGSAAAVTASLCSAATGTDTGGSIRQPAALTGLTGIKPTYGRVSRYGMIAFASSLDQGGPLGRSAQDVALLLAAMAGFDERDSTSVDQPVEHYVQQLSQPLAGLTIGVIEEHFAAGLDREVAQIIEHALREYERLGAQIRRISLPHSALSVPVYYVVAPAECSSNLARYDGVRYGYRAEAPAGLEDLYKRSRAEGFGAEVKRRIMIGTYALSAGYYDAYYLKAQKLRRLISEDFKSAFSAVDVIMGPTSPTVSFKLGEKLADPVTMYI